MIIRDYHMGFVLSPTVSTYDNFVSPDVIYKIPCYILFITSCRMTKSPVRPAKTQIRLGQCQSDQSLCCPHEETLGSELPTELTLKTLIRLGVCPNCQIWVFSGGTGHFVSFVMHKLKWYTFISKQKLCLEKVCNITPCHLNNVRLIDDMQTLQSSFTVLVQHSTPCP